MAGPQFACSQELTRAYTDLTELRLRRAVSGRSCLGVVAAPLHHVPSSSASMVRLSPSQHGRFRSAHLPLPGPVRPRPPGRFIQQYLKTRIPVGPSQPQAASLREATSRSARGPPGCAQCDRRGPGPAAATRGPRQTLSRPAPGGGARRRRPSSSVRSGRGLSSSLGPCHSAGPAPGRGVHTEGGAFTLPVPLSHGNLAQWQWRAVLCRFHWQRQATATVLTQWDCTSSLPLALAARRSAAVLASDRGSDSEWPGPAAE